MASIFNYILSFLLFLFLITNSIHGYRLNHQIDSEDQFIIDDDIKSYNKINHRSVLWPKICFTTLVKKNNHQYPFGQNQQRRYNKRISTRNARKCYPFDTT